MSRENERDRWMQDVDARQRSVVFPKTLENETRFWRNIGNQPWTTTTKIGLALMALFVIGFGAALLVAGVGEAGPWGFPLLMLLVCGPIFFAISWATRRALRQARSKRTTRQR